MTFFHLKGILASRICTDSTSQILFHGVLTPSLRPFIWIIDSDLLEFHLHGACSVLFSCVFMLFSLHAGIEVFVGEISVNNVSLGGTSCSSQIWDFSINASFFPVVCCL